MSTLADHVYLDGKQFGRLTAMWPAGKKGAQIYYLCACTCGKIKPVSGSNLRSGKCRSCGCYMVDAVRKSNTVHGHTKGQILSPEFQSWQAMNRRCYYKGNIGYDNYGGRGIRVCERWREFTNFLEDMGPRPEGTSLDRINNEGDYNLQNCRWATKSEQVRNRRVNYKANEVRKRWPEIISLRKQGLSLSQLAKTFNVSICLIRTILIEQQGSSSI